MTRSLHTCPVCNTDQYFYAKKFVKHGCSADGLFLGQARNMAQLIKSNSLPIPPKD